MANLKKGMQKQHKKHADPDEFCIICDKRWLGWSYGNVCSNCIEKIVDAELVRLKID